MKRLLLVHWLPFLLLCKLKPNPQDSLLRQRKRCRKSDIPSGFDLLRENFKAFPMLFEFSVVVAFLSFAWFYKSMSSCLNNRSWFTSSTLWLRVAKQSINREREHSLLPSQPPKFVLDSPGETTYLCFGGRSVRFSRLLFNGHPLIYCLFILLLGT